MTTANAPATLTDDDPLASPTVERDDTNRRYSVIGQGVRRHFYDRNYKGSADRAREAATEFLLDLLAPHLDPEAPDQVCTRCQRRAHQCSCGM
jgi:hypothetical protein